MRPTAATLREVDRGVVYATTVVCFEHLTHFESGRLGLSSIKPTSALVLLANGLTGSEGVTGS